MSEPILLWNDLVMEEGKAAPSVTPYLLPGDALRPAVLVIPGGGYGGVCHSTEGKPIAEAFNRRGLHAFVLHYLTAPHAFPAPLADAVRAMKLIRGLEPDNLKRTITGDKLRPRFAVMNPEFTFTLPPYQTACGLVDIFAHVVERYFTPTRDVRITDELCEAVMRTVVAESAAVMRNPKDYQARANIMWAGTLAHNNVCGVGRAQDWASHGIEHELSALYDCAHGAGLAVVMPAWMEFVMPADTDRFARFAEKVWGVAQGDTATMAKEGLARYRGWIKSLGMPTTFAELGAKEEDIPLLAANLGLKDGQTLGTFRQLTTADVESILRLCV